MLSGIDPNFVQATESGLAAFTALAGTKHGFLIDVEPVEGNTDRLQATPQICTEQTLTCNPLMSGPSDTEAKI